MDNGVETSREPTDRELRMWAVDQAVAAGAQPFTIRQAAEQIMAFVSRKPKMDRAEAEPQAGQREPAPDTPIEVKVETVGGESSTSFLDGLLRDIFKEQPIFVEVDAKKGETIEEAVRREVNTGVVDKEERCKCRGCVARRVAIMRGERDPKSAPAFGQGGVGMKAEPERMGDLIGSRPNPKNYGQTIMTDVARHRERREEALKEWQRTRLPAERYSQERSFEAGYDIGFSRAKSQVRRTEDIRRARSVLQAFVEENSGQAMSTGAMDHTIRRILDICS